MRNSGNNSKKGFTLAELLLVVAIIAVLVAIAIPVFRVQVEKAKASSNKSTIRQAKSAAIDVYYESGGQLDVIYNPKGKPFNTSYYLYDVETGTMTKQNFKSFKQANDTANKISEKAANGEKITQVYVYIGESDQAGSSGGIDIETAPYYKNGKVYYKKGGNPFGFSE